MVTEVSNARLNQDLRRDGWRVVKRVIPYLWPDDEAWVRRRVVIAMGFLLLSKVVAVMAAPLFGAATDALAGEEAGPAWMLGAGAIGLTLAYGVSRLINVGFQQMRDVVFALVGQRALRMLALETFTHIWYLVVVLVTLALYTWFTFAVTEWRVKMRKEMNDQDTDANQKAIDSLLNFETVKYFGAEKREAERYDSAMEKYVAAALNTSYSLAFLNFGQSLLITGGLVAVMVMAAMGVQEGSLTVGDFVMVNAYMIQIVTPLNFLGTVYREIRQALVDMGEMFDLLGQPAEVQDKDGAAELEVERGVVELHDVQFGYDAARPILCRRTRCCSTTRCFTTLHMAGLTPRGMRSSRRRRTPRSMTSSCRCRMGMTPPSASAG